MPPTPEWITWTTTSSCWILPSSSIAASTDPWTSALITRLSSLTAPSCTALKRSSRLTDFDRRASISCAAAGRAAAPSACNALVLDHVTELAGGRRAVETQNLDRRSRPGVANTLAAVVVERLDLAPGVTGDDRVSDAKRSARDEERRHRAASDVEPRFDDDTGRRSVGVRVEIEHVGLQQDRVEQLVEVRSGLCRDVLEDRLAAPLRRLKALLGQLLACAVGIGVRPVDLVDRHHDRHVGRAAWSIASTVCGMTPSSAATTSTATSVTFAPRARIAVNASWPGVSRNVTLRPSGRPPGRRRCAG